MSLSYLRLVAFAFAVVAQSLPVAGAPTAVLVATGPSVLVNGAAAKTGTVIRSGDQVATGKDSSAKVQWSDGTTVIFDENSGPMADCESWVVGLRVGCGWFLVRTGSSDVQIVTELVKVRRPSILVARIDPGPQLQLFVLEGRVDLLGTSEKRTLQSKDVALVTQGAKATPSRRFGTISAEQAASIKQRFARWGH